MRTNYTRLLSPLAPTLLLALAGIAQAQPVLELHSMIDADLSASGNKAVGYIYDANIEQYRVYVWERGVGYSAIPQVEYAIEQVRASDDATVIATGARNTTNWGDLNCFNGYCNSFGVNCTPGDPLPPLDPCQIPNIAHRYTTAGGWQNLGSVERIFTPGVNRFSGGTRCDSSINSVGDISGDGRFTVGGAWSTGLFTSSGDVSFGLCGNLVAFIHDANTGILSRLPVAPDNAGDSRADNANFDGSVITGYDFGPVESEFGTFDARRVCVWTNGVQTIIDDVSGFGDGPVVNSAGTALAGVPGFEFNNQTFGVQDTLLVKWTRQPDNSWTPSNLGRPVDYFDGVSTRSLLFLNARAISNDGNIIVGTATYGDFFDRVQRAFIWSPTINGGVPMDLTDYIVSIAPTSPLADPGLSFTSANDISDDGTAINVQITDARTTCPPETFGLFTGLNGVLYLNGVPACSPPQIVLSPADTVVTQYTSFGVALNVTVSGTFPMNFQWQREDAVPGTWNNLGPDACAGFGFGAEWDYEGTTKNQLRIGQENCGNGRDGAYRVVVSNACGTATSDAADVSFAAGTQINVQPTPQATCPGQGAFMFAVAISNTSNIPTTWEIALASAPENFTGLLDGTNILPDGRVADVFGATGQFMGITPQVLGEFEPSAYIVRAVFDSLCGGATTDAVTLDVAGVCPLVCDSIDFNNDGLFPDDQDLVDFLSVFAGGPCSTEFCNDVDFNNDELFPDDADLVAFLRVLAGGGCE